MYSGELSLRRAARLAYQLPPGAAIYRSDELDRRVLSDESIWLRNLASAWSEDKIKFPSDLVAEEERAQQVREKAERRAAEAAARSG